MNPNPRWLVGGPFAVTTTADDLMVGRLRFSWTGVERAMAGPLQRQGGRAGLSLKLRGEARGRVYLVDNDDEASLLALQRALKRCGGGDPDAAPPGTPFSFRPSTVVGEPGADVLEIMAAWPVPGLGGQLPPVQGGKLSLREEGLVQPAQPLLPWKSMAALSADDGTVTLALHSGELRRWRGIVARSPQDVDWLVHHLQDRLSDWRDPDATANRSHIEAGIAEMKARTGS